MTKTARERSLRRRVVLLGGAGLLLGGGAATAAVLTPHSIVRAASVPAAAPAAPADDSDNINVQQGDQTTPDPAGPKASAETEKSGAEGETTIEEPGGQNLPGGGHADPPGQNVDHQFEGVE